MFFLSFFILHIHSSSFAIQRLSLRTPNPQAPRCITDPPARTPPFYSRSGIVVDRRGSSCGMDPAIGAVGRGNPQRSARGEQGRARVFLRRGHHGNDRNAELLAEVRPLIPDCRWRATRLSLALLLNPRCASSRGRPSPETWNRRCLREGDPPEVQPCGLRPLSPPLTPRADVNRSARSRPSSAGKTPGFPDVSTR